MDDNTGAFDAPRDNLTRSLEFRADPSEDGLNLDGIAAVFDEWTEIDSWEGRFKERIARGAFKKTLSERTPVLQFDHGHHPMIGSIPLGAITHLREEPEGLRVKARMSDNWLVQPVRDAIQNGSITGMSIRFRVVKDTIVKPRGSDMPERTINEIALMELGPVVFPAYTSTSVGVRSRELLTALTDPEQRAELARLLLGTAPAAAEHPTPELLHVNRTNTPTGVLALLNRHGRNP